MSRRKDKVDPVAAQEKKEKEAEERKKAEAEALRKQIIKEQRDKDPIFTYVEALQDEEVGDPLHHEEIYGEPEEWSNIPKLVARFVIHTQSHLNAVVGYLRERSSEETSHSLRQYVEEQNTEQNLQFNEYKKSSSDDIQNLYDLDRKINEYATNIDSSFHSFKNYCDAFKQDDISQLVKAESAGDVLSDNVGQGQVHLKDVIVFGESPEYEEAVAVQRKEAEDEGKFFSPIPNSEENPLCKARMMSLKQHYEFFNYCLNKSFLRKRTKVNEDHIHTLQDQAKDLYAWRADIEKRMQDKFKAVDDHFSSNADALEKYQRKVQKTFDEKTLHLETHNAEINQIHVTLQSNKEDREELHKQQEFHAQKLDREIYAMDKKLNEKFTRLLDKQNYAEKEINQSIQLLSKELEKLKYELSDVIDSKFEHITRSMEIETKKLRATYDELSGSLSKTNRELNQSFKDKAHTIKSMCSTFFAKIETQVKDNNNRVEKIQISHDKFESNFVNPAKEIDAKVYSMQEKIQNSELMRESQFSMIKDTLRQLIYALEIRHSSIYNVKEGILSILLAQQSLSPMLHPNPDLVSEAQGGAPMGPQSQAKMMSNIPSLQNLGADLNVNIEAFTNESSDRFVALYPSNDTHDRSGVRLPDITSPNAKNAKPTESTNFTQSPPMNKQRKKRKEKGLRSSRSEGGILRGKMQEQTTEATAEKAKEDPEGPLAVGPAAGDAVNSKIGMLPSGASSFARQEGMPISRSIAEGNDTKRNSEDSQRSNQMKLKILQKKSLGTLSKKQIQPYPPGPSSLTTEQVASALRLNLVGPVNEIKEIMRSDFSIFNKRLVFIRRILEEEVQPMRMVSRDHTRTNRNGIKLDLLDKMGRRSLVQPPGSQTVQAQSGSNPFRKERRSLDISAQPSASILKNQVTPGSTAKKHFDQFQLYPSEQFTMPNSGSKPSIERTQTLQNKGESAESTTQKASRNSRVQQILPSGGEKSEVMLSINLPSAIGQGLTPSNIKIKSNQRLERVEETLTPSRLTSMQQQQFFKGSSQNPDNIGLQTSSVKIIQLNQAKKQAGGSKMSNKGASAEQNLKKHLQSNVQHQLLLQQQLQLPVPGQKASKLETAVDGKPIKGVHAAHMALHGLMKSPTGQYKFNPHGVGAQVHEQIADGGGTLIGSNGGQTTMRLVQQSETNSREGLVGNTPSLLSPIKHESAIGGADTTLYSVPSPIRMQAIHDPMREAEMNIRHQQELLERKLNQKSQMYKNK